MAKLREIRERRYMTQEELAGKAKLSKSTIATLEVGSHRPRMRTMRQLAEALGVEPGEIEWPTVNGKSTDTVH